MLESRGKFLKIMLVFKKRTYNEKIPLSTQASGASSIFKHDSLIIEHA